MKLSVIEKARNEDKCSRKRRGKKLSALEEGMKFCCRRMRGMKLSSIGEGA
jgi:hypothetical protein